MLEKVRNTPAFRILSLDGGGIKGTFTAGVLAELEAKTGRRCVDHFDLIAGTSTGGILAIGLAMGCSAQELLDFYKNRGPEIFPSTGVKARFGWLRQMLGPKHSQQRLRQEISAVLGNRRLGEARARLVIPTYDAVRGRIFIMKTAHTPRFINEIGLPATEVALATSAAPTYFQAAQVDGGSYVDGGVWANCPAMVAVTEAISFLDARAGHIDILSIGTTSTTFNIASKRNAGALKWNTGIIELMFEGQAEAARNQAALIGGKLHRIDCMVMRDQMTMDNATRQTVEDLAKLGRDVASEKAHLETVRERFLNGRTVAPFRPFAGAAA